MSSGPTGLLFKQRNEHLETGRELPGITRWHAFSKDRTVLCATSFLPFLNLDQGKESRHRERERETPNSRVHYRLRALGRGRGTLS